MYVVLLLEEEYYIQGPRWAPAGGTHPSSKRFIPF
jgi:hypothetical protein